MRLASRIRLQHSCEAVHGSRHQKRAPCWTSQRSPCGNSLVRTGFSNAVRPANHTSEVGGICRAAPNSHPAQAGGNAENPYAKLLAITSVVYAGLALITCADPVLVVKLGLLATNVYEYTILAAMCSSGFVLAAAVSHCLKEAAEHDRLASETYKRLTAGVKFWAALVLVLQLVSFQVTSILSVLLFFVATAPTLYVTSQFHQLSTKTMVGFLNGVGELFTIKKAAGIPYAVFAVPCVLGAPLLLSTSTFPLWPAVSLTGEAIFLQQVVAMGLFLLAVVLYVLKDAAERGRSGASTFRTLNLATSVAALLQALWLYFGRYLASDNTWTAVAMGYSGLVAGYCGLQYAFAKK